MTTHNNFDITNKAIQQVIDNNQPFSEIYFQFAKEWVSKRFKQFTSDDIRKAFLDAGNDPPREPRAFGGIMQSLSYKGLIFKTGETLKSARPECHNRPLDCWISKEYSETQSKNRKYKQPELNFNF